MEAGLVRDDFSAEHLVWELLAPVAYVRLLYLHGRATEEERSSAGHPKERVIHRIGRPLYGTPSGT